MEIPILYCIFNRIDTVKKTFEPIKQAKPKRIYIAADGPRKDKEGEDKLTEEVRKYVLSQIDWDCEIFTKFEKENIGCEKSLYGGIKWMFEKEEAGIILEDDILTNQCFLILWKKCLSNIKITGK